MSPGVTSTLYYWRNAKHGPKMARLVFDNADSIEVPLKEPVAFEASRPRWDEAVAVLLQSTRDGRWSGQYYDAQRNWKIAVGEYELWEQAALNALRARHSSIADHEARVADPALNLEFHLKRHDWRYAMSDDRRSYDGGRANMDEIRRLIRLVPVEVSRRLWNQYAPADCDYPVQPG